VNIPAVIIGDRVVVKLPVKVIRIIPAIVFAALGAFILKTQLATLPKHGGPIKSV
jgi:putative Ca2+/H+ antiporter (TMEM165/GDT1 family)